MFTPYVFGMIARMSPESPDTPEVKQTIDSVFSAGTFDRVQSQYVCACSNYLVFGKVALGDPAAIVRNRAFIEQYFWKLAPSHLSELASHRVCSLSAFLQVTGVSLPYFDFMAPNDLGLSLATPWHRAKQSVHQLADMASSSPLARHYLFDVVLVIAVVTGLMRRKWALFIGGLVGLSYLAPFFVVDPCADWRYQFLNHVFALICLGAFADWGVEALLKRLEAPRPGATV